MQPESALFAEEDGAATTMTREVGWMRGDFCAEREDVHNQDCLMQSGSLPFNAIVASNRDRYLLLVLLLPVRFRSFSFSSSSRGQAPAAPQSPSGLI